MSPASTSIRPFEHAYTTGLLALQHKTLAEMCQQQILPHSHTHSADLLAGDPQPHRSGLAHRLKQAPPGGILAVDLLTVKHEGASIQGVGRVYSSTDNGVVWGHAFVSSALVYPDQDPFPLQLAPFPTEQMATPTYPRLSATEGMLNIVGDVIEAGYEVKAAVFDAQFSTRLGLRSLKFMPIAFVGRFRTDAWVFLGRERVQVRTLAERYRPGRSRWYKRFGWYAKRLEVWLAEVGRVDLVLVWKGKGTDWECFALISSVHGGVQSVLNIWKLRWDLEWSHRLYKQNLGLGKCQCRRFSSQLNRTIRPREKGDEQGKSWTHNRVCAGQYGISRFLRPPRIVKSLLLATLSSNARSLSRIQKSGNAATVRHGNVRKMRCGPGFLAPH